MGSLLWWTIKDRGTNREISFLWRKNKILSWAQNKVRDSDHWNWSETEKWEYTTIFLCFLSSRMLSNNTEHKLSFFQSI